MKIVQGLPASLVQCRGSPSRWHQYESQHCNGLAKVRQNQISKAPDSHISHVLPVVARVLETPPPKGLQCPLGGLSCTPASLSLRRFRDFAQGCYPPLCFSSSLATSNANLLPVHTKEPLRGAFVSLAIFFGRCQQSELLLHTGNEQRVILAGIIKADTSTR